MVTHKGTQDIKTERLVLRKILPDDAEMVYKWQDCDYYSITQNEYKATKTSHNENKYIF